MDKKERLAKAFDYLRDSGLAHTRKDIADKMGATTSSVSSAFNGNEAFLTDNFLKRFNRAYGNIFNLKWLMIDEGEMLADEAAINQSVKGCSNNFAAQGNVTTNNTTSGISDSVMERAFTEISELRKLLQDAVSNNINLSNRLMNLLEKLSDKI